MRQTRSLRSTKTSGTSTALRSAGKLRPVSQTPERGVAPVTPNNSLNARLAPARHVSTVRASRTIDAARAYKSCLRSRG